MNFLSKIYPTFCNLETNFGSDSNTSTKCESFKSEKVKFRRKVLSKESLKQSSEPYIGTITEAPQYLKKGSFILTGYRINFNNFKTVIKSLFMLHNETTNIWSHLSGVFIYMFLIVYIMFWTAPSDQSLLKDDDTILGLPVWWINSMNRFIAKYILWVDKDVVGTPEISKIPMYIHMWGNITCMSLSSIYHLFSCHSKEVNCKLYKYDYSGVSLMISCSVYPPYIYGYMCPQVIHFAYIYTTIINVSSLLLLIVCIHPKFDNDKLRWLRSFLYCVVGLAWGWPAVHSTFLGKREEITYANIHLWGWGGAFFIFGAFVYTKRFPEKQYPGKYDIFGQSHNIWHFFVLLGGITHFFASLSSYYGNRTHICPA